VDAFWSQLSKLRASSERVRTDLDADKAQLQAAYTATKADPDPQRRTVSQSALQPLIHNNSVLRVRYRDLAAKFNAAVAAAGSVLKSAGLVTPQLGAVPLLVPVVAVTALGVAFAIYQAVRTQTDAQRKATNAMLAIINDSGSTNEERAAALAALAKSAGSPPPSIFPGLGQLLPIIALVAVIVVGPQLLRSFAPRRAAA
jgi:hypothetical protein